jgi:hypothetical protein
VLKAGGHAKVCVSRVLAFLGGGALSESFGTLQNAGEGISGRHGTKEEGNGATVEFDECSGWRPSPEVSMGHEATG